MLSRCLGLRQQNGEAIQKIFMILIVYEYLSTLYPSYQLALGLSHFNSMDGESGPDNIS
jgi:hypothetical protein